MDHKTRNLMTRQHWRDDLHIVTRKEGREHATIDHANTTIQRF